MERSWEQQRKRMARRQAVLNEIHFTHDRMARLLRAMMAREGKGHFGELIVEQHAHELKALRGIVSLALDLGTPPGPCVCAEGAALVEAIYNADRLPRADVNRVLRIQERLLEARRSIIGLWSRLADEVKQDHHDQELYPTIIRYQSLEADQHRSIVRSIARTGNGHDVDGMMRSA